MPRKNHILKTIGWLGEFQRLRFYRVLASLLFSATSHAIIYAPIGTLRLSNNGVLSTAVTFGSPGLTILGYGGSQINGGSAAGLQASFPFTSSEDKRVSGWNFGFGVGSSETAIVDDKLFSPGLYYLEFAIGRGTAIPLLDRDTGIRGFMEFFYRDDRLRSSDRSQSIFSLLETKFPIHQYSAGIRIGAGNDLNGSGLVEQAPPKISFRFFYGLYVPLSNQTTAMNISSESYVKCWSKIVSCGLSVEYLYFWPNKRNLSSTLNFRNFLSYGPSIKAQWSRKYDFKIKGYWTYIQGDSNLDGTQIRQTVISKDPGVAAQFSVAF